jgi:hypothetical protein
MIFVSFNNNTTVHTTGAGPAFPSEAPEFTPGFSPYSCGHFLESGVKQNQTKPNLILATIEFESPVPLYTAVNKCAILIASSSSSSKIFGKSK